MRLSLIAGVSVLAVIGLLGGCGRQRSPQDKLIDAAATGNIQQIKTLLASGVSVNCRSSGADRGTPLTWAVVERQEEAVQLLLESGADPNIHTATGKTPLALALGGAQEDTGRIIRELVIAGASFAGYTTYFDSLPPSDPKRVAFETAVKERSAEKGR
jgi:ankyrin repeat protein